MNSLGDTIRDFNSDSKIRRIITEAKALNIWKDVVGDVINANTNPVRITTGTLYIRVKSSTWAQELKGLEITIIDQINKKLGVDLVKEIRFFQGSTQKHNEEKYESNLVIPDIDRQPITDKEKSCINKITSDIESDELKSTIARLFIKDKKLQRWREEKESSL